MSNQETISDPIIERGEPARLIPAVADTSRERRVVSSLLATMAAVPEFGRAILAPTEAPQAPSYRITAFTEVVLRGAEAGNLRPDGLIRLQRGQTAWTALIEAKVGNGSLTTEQIEQYVTLAAEAHLDAVVTISNQLSGMGSYPVAIDGRKLKAIGLHHFPWMHILAQAILLERHKGISDPDQAFILRELIRYLHHPSSGVLSFDSMPPEWKEICAHIQTSDPIAPTNQLVSNTVTAWTQLSHHLALQLSVAIGRNVSVWYTRPEMQFPEQRYKKDVGSLCGEGILSTEFEIPESASRLKLFVDLKRRNVSASMTLASPGDRNTAKSAVGWVLGQLSKCQDDTILIRATWPRRQPSTSATVGALRKDRSVLLNGGDQVPTQFELVRIVDLAGKFRGSRTFVDAVETVLQSFYTDIGQNLRSWVPAAPRVKLPNAGEILEGSEPTEGYPVTTARQELVPVDQAKAAETPDTDPLGGPIVGADLQIPKTAQQPSDPQPVLPDTPAK